MLSTRSHTFTIEYMSSTLGNFIQNRRVALGLTQAELGRRADIPRTTVNRVETGTTKLPDASVRRALAKALGVSHLELLVVAGEISQSESQMPEDPRSATVRRISPIVDSFEWSDAGVEQLANIIETVGKMHTGDFDMPKIEE